MVNVEEPLLTKPVESKDEAIPVIDEWINIIQYRSSIISLFVNC